MNVPGVSARSVDDPEGRSWRVGRTWLPRPKPKLKLGEPPQFVVDLADRVGSSVLSRCAWGTPELDPEGYLLAIAGFALLMLIVLVILPLVIFGVELMILVAVVGGVGLGSVFLGRPWTVFASPPGTGEEALLWRVRGWKESRKAIDEISEAIASGEQPAGATLQT